MKTNNIFRMLLVAVALLLGANNVKATEIPLWSSESPKTVGWYDSDPVMFSNESFRNASPDDIVRINGNGTSSWQLKLAVGDRYGNRPDVSGSLKQNSGTAINGHVDIPLTQEMINQILADANGNVFVAGWEFTVSSVVLVTASSGGGTQTTTYTVTVNAGSNGTASVDKTTAPAGETVTITTNPSSGYEVNTITGVDVTKTGTNTYTFTMPSNNVTVNVTFKAVTPAETVYAAISSSTGYATFSSLKNLDFSTVTGLKAYIATNVSGDQVHLVQVKGVVPARTGLILKGTPSTSISIPVTTSDATLSQTNLLRPGEGYSLALSPNYTDYVLVATETGVAFAEVYDSNHLPLITQDKAYLHITNNGARKRSLSITFPDDHTTGISNIENETTGDNVVYNLRGQRVDNPTKGIYIVNGKKVLFR